MNWILIGYIVTIVINYVILKKVRRTTKDCPGCTYKYCSRHYSWGDVFKSFFISLGGYLSLICLIVGSLIAVLVNIISNTNKKPPKWL